MKFWLPFKDRAPSGEAGNMLLITGLMASALAVTGGKVMLDRSIAQRKANQMAQSMKQAKEIPGSAAMIAKALISLPPSVASNISVEWTTPKLVSTPTNMPLIYPIPYVSGVIGSPALPAISVDKTVEPPAGANWDNFNVTGTTSTLGVFASASVNIYANDSARATSNDINTAIAGRAVAGGSATIKRTKSVVTYSFRNCTAAGVTSISFTGRYCATATIDSPNYASDKKGSDSASAVSNKGVAQLGLVTPPPAPLCGAVSTPGNAKVRSGDAFSLNVNATGVAIGYRVELISPAETLASSGTVPITLPFDHPSLPRLHTISGIPTSGVTSALNQPGVSEMALHVVLIGIDRSETTCNAVVQLDKPIVVCEPGSFSVSRTGADLRTCNISLRKDNGMGVVKQVQVVQTNTRTGASSTSTPPENFTSNNWSTTFLSPKCEQDSLTFTASLIREYPLGTPVAPSQCSPQQSIAELPPKCDQKIANNPAYTIGRVPHPPLSNLLNCNVTVERTPDSHTDAKVWIDGADKDSSGTWASNVWTGQVPCAASATTMRAELRKGPSASACWNKPIVTVDPAAQCVANSTAVYRMSANLSQCYVTLKRIGGSSQFVDVKIDGAIKPGGWTGLDWRSNNFSCSLGTETYVATLTGANGVPSSCGAATIPAQPPVCASLAAARTSPTSPTCNVTMTKGSGGGAVTSAIVNNSTFSTADQTTYNTTTPCATGGATITGSLSNSGGVGSCPSATVAPGVCISSFQQCTGTAETCMAQADAGLGISTGQTGTPISAVGSDSVLSFYAANNGGAMNRFSVTNAGKIYVMLVGGGGGAGGWQVAAGGAGGGGVKRGLLTICPGTYNVTVGPAGIGRAGIGHGDLFSTHGGNSSIGNLVVAQGGGTTSSTDQGGTVHPGRCPAGGWGPSNQPPVNSANALEFMYNNAGTAFCRGGSGGGGSPLWGRSWPGGRPYASEPYQEGNNGGLGRENFPNNPAAGGGGGGAGAAGTNATIARGGNGGNGIQSDITGTNNWYAGGGGGGHTGGVTKRGSGGLGGGGAGCSVAGTARTGGGGGGGCCGSCAGGNGGPGIVVIRFKP